MTLELPLQILNPKIFEEIGKKASLLWCSKELRLFKSKLPLMFQKTASIDAYPVRIQGPGGGNNVFIRYVSPENATSVLEFLEEGVSLVRKKEKEDKLLKQILTRLRKQGLNVQLDDETFKVIFSYGLQFGLENPVVLHRVPKEIRFSPEGGDIEGLLQIFWDQYHTIQSGLQDELLSLESSILELTSDVGIIKETYSQSIEKWKKSILNEIGRRKALELARKTKLEIQQVHYSDHFPVARSLQRKIYFYAGPTNSGKTHYAFEDLVKYESGAYLAPLRLMAFEGREEIRRRGQECDLLTGEESITSGTSKFIASTVEMLNFSWPLSAVVIDEIQMLEDRQRGSAFTAALVGAPAKNVILTGSPKAIEIVQRIGASLGEEVLIHKLERLTPLRILKSPYKLDKKLEKGTAIIAFSRADIIGLREELSDLGYSVSVIYGALGPEVRNEEARRFREGETDVLVASDAVGMGLNLPIRKIIFFTLFKFDGEGMETIESGSAKQIAGRAGRFGQYSMGTVSALSRRDVTLLSDLLNEEDIPIRLARVAPLETQILKYIEMTGSSFSNAYANLININSDEFFSAQRLESPLSIAARIDRRPLAIQEKLRLIYAPVDLKKEEIERVFFNWVSQMSERKPIILSKTLLARPKAVGSSRDLENLEENAKIMTLYRWLNQRFPEYFLDIKNANEQLEWVNERIIETLKKRVRKYCAECRKILENLSPHKLCDPCHFKSRSERYNPWDDDVFNE